MEHLLLQALHVEPADHTARLALSDWLEEDGCDQQAELLRLNVRQMQGVGLAEELNRINDLLRAGTVPVVPEMVNSLGMRLALIPPGTFPIWGQPGDFPNDDPIPILRTELTLTRAYYLGVHPVTQSEFERVMQRNPSAFTAQRKVCRGEDVSRFPVESVTWVEARDFCRALSSLPEERAAGRVYRLPTEAEWERACRGGAHHHLPFHNGEQLDGWGNFCGNYRRRKGKYLKRPSVVGSYPPNAFGLYDMLGNVWEWCADWFTECPFRRRRVDPPGPNRGSTRSCRGGCWAGLPTACWTAYRIGMRPDEVDDRFGFRVACTWTPPAERSDP